MMTTSDGSSEEPSTGSHSHNHDSHDHGHDHTHDHNQEPEESPPTTDTQGDVTQFVVPEMDCPSCAGKVENSVRKLDGIIAIDPQVTTGTLSVTYEGERTTPEAIVSAIEGAGYEVTDSTTTAPDTESATDDRESIWTSSRAIKMWISGGIVALGLLFEFFLSSQNVLVAEVVGRELFVADVLFLVAVGIAGQTIFRNGYYSALNRNLDIDLLMSIAISGAIIASLVFGEALYFEAATLAVLFSIAELLERHSMDQARNSLQELMDLSPDEATVKRDGSEITVPVDDVSVGDIVVVRPGEKIPMDGDVTEGESAVNQAPITGESVPVDKMPGDDVYAGTINEGGYLEIEVTSTASENTLSRIVQMVEDAQANKTEREQFVERFSTYYTPIVVGFAVLVTLLSPSILGTSWSQAVVHGLTLLVLACPCAFVISTPVSVVSGITSAAKNGVLIKGGNHLESMGAVEAIAVDKTGTQIGRAHV